MSTFSSLSDEEKALVRAAQLRRKQAKAAAKAAAEPSRPADAELTDAPTRCLVTRDEYMSACPSGLFRDRSLPPTAESLNLVLSVLEAGTEKARWLNDFNYFQFYGPPRELWDPEFFVRLAWEGFFTITASTGPNRSIEPLPELQPFYGVLTWPNFEASKHVRATLRRLGREGRGYRLSNCADPERTWRQIEAYHEVQHGSNWLTRQYFETMLAAHRDPSLNFTLNCFELCLVPPADEAGGAAGAAAPPERPAEISAGGRVRFVGLEGRADLNGAEGVAEAFDGEARRWSVRSDGEAGVVRARPANLQPLAPAASAVGPPIAGEIGYTIGGVYTSLSGWTGERTAAAVGTAQLVLLGRWLQRKGVDFWSLGHCYSPEMDYKRQLGHRIYTRTQFRELIQRHRGPLHRADGRDSLAAAPRFAEGEVCDEAELINAQGSQPQLP